MNKYYSKMIKRIGIAGLGMMCFFGVSAQTKTPKNIIFIIGDGMGHSCIEATNYYTTGKTEAQIYENFPVKTWQSTFNTKNPKGLVDGVMDNSKAEYFDLEYRSDSAWIDFDWVRRDADVRQVVKGQPTTHTNGQMAYSAARYTDSAPAATALATGVKTFDGGINYDVDGLKLTTIAERAIEMGKKAGVVTTVQLSHATPAGFVAHNVDRNKYEDISKEMFLNSKLSVIIGTGHPDYNDDAEYVEGKNGYGYVGGETIWNQMSTSKMLSAETDIDGDGVADAWSFIETTDDFIKMANGEIPAPKRLIGVPQAGATLQAYRSGAGDEVLAVPYNTGVPTLVDMSLAALNVLDNPNGFFVMIEGGAIDWANHNNETGRMIEEMIDLNNTVDAVVEWIEANGGWDENLLIVTTDHECGYILGPNTQGETVNNPIDNPIVNNGKGNTPGLSYNSLQHTNMLCPVYAKGAGSEVLKTHESRTDFYRGRYIDNTDIPRTLFSLWSDNEPEIKNFILMVSDGWGYNQVQATNYYEGKTQSYEQDDFIEIPMSTYPGRRGGFQKTDITASDFLNSYNSNKAWSDFSYVMDGYTDSAPAASAMATGEKIYDSALNYSIIEDEPMVTITELAARKGKSTGVVTSVELSHATPAGLGGAHNRNRNAYVDIAREMFFDTKLSVIIGTGNPEYDNQAKRVDLSTSNETAYQWVGGKATWEALKNGAIVSEGKTLQDINGDGYSDAWTLVQDSIDFDNIAKGKNVPLRLAGVPKVHETLQSYRANGRVGASGDLYGANKFTADSIPWNQNLPRLSHMSLAALNVLNQNENGFYVMIEGGAVDWANHANQLGIMIEDQRDFNQAVDSVIQWIERNSSWDETLLVVTGDHECGYLLGPDHKDKTDNNPNTNPIIDKGVGVVPGHSYHSPNHTNQLIPVYVKGSNADKYKKYQNIYDFVRGYYMDNTDLPHLVMESWNKLPDSRPNIVTGIDQINANYSDQILNVYPTVFDDYLTVETEKGNKIDVFDLKGQLRHSEYASDSRVQINLSQLGKGLYIIKSSAKSAKVVKR